MINSGADLLLELFSEEIPARMQEDALEHLKSSLAIQLSAKHKILPDSGWAPKGYVTPRRLAVMITDLPVAQAASETELKGPKAGAPEAAIQGFLKKNGLSQNDLVERDGVYFAIVKKESKQTATLLKTIIEDILASFPWPKSMRWGSGDTTWVRPLHSILCIFDGKIIPVTFAGVTAGNTTRGHRFLKPETITISNPADYEAALEKAFVIADREKRKAAILEQAQKAAKAASLSLKKDDGLLEEVTGLVEWPVILTGSIDAKYMDLPKEVLVSEMRAHQKYFALEKADGTLSDKFLITSNMNSTDGGKAIIAGNERVLRARLSDGRFFWDQDRKKPLGEWAEGLKSVTFHAKLGTIADKVERIKKLADKLADHVFLVDKKHVQQAAKLCKADLVTGMVGEFAELQGIMGGYYAEEEGLPEEVVDAIRDHYKPQGPNDNVPLAGTTICISLADKLDTLISMFTIGEKPTGSKDPFALRRNALGIIRIILEKKIRLQLSSIIKDYLHFDDFILWVIRNDKDAPNYVHKKLISVKKYPGAKTVREKMHHLTPNHRPESDHYELIFEGEDFEVPHDIEESELQPLRETTLIALLNFFIDRLKVQLKDSGIRHDVINAVVANGDDDLVRIVKRAEALQAFLGTDDGANLLVAYKRGVNILDIEEKKDKKTYSGIISSNAENRSIEPAINTSTGTLEAAIREERFKDAMNILAGLRKPVDEFLDNRLINDSDIKKREENLIILSHLRRNFSWIANFALIEGESKEQKKAA